jgi:molybdopterin/thiamine biosynthesis adenylyltransferase
MNFFERQIPLIGEDCQKRLKNSVVLIGGIGGLGSTVSQLLVRMGIGKLYLVDYDIVEESNLHRQSLYSVSDIGKFKADISAIKLKEIGFNTNIVKLKERIEESFKIPKDVDVVADCLDNPKSKIILSRLSKNKYFIHAGVEEYVGQIITLKNKSLDEVIKFSEKTKKPIIPTLVNVVGSIQANEVINILCKKETLLNKILFVDMLNYDFSIVGVENV